MKTLQDEWKRYRDACYPQGIPENQNAECHQAFFSGAMAALNLATEISSEMNEEDAFRQIGILMHESQEVCKKRIKNMKGNRN